MDKQNYPLPKISRYTLLMINQLWIYNANYIKLIISGWSVKSDKSDGICPNKLNVSTSALRLINDSIMFPKLLLTARCKVSVW